MNSFIYGNATMRERVWAKRANHINVWKRMQHYTSRFDSFDPPAEFLTTIRRDAYLAENAEYHTALPAIRVLAGSMERAGLYLDDKVFAFKVDGCELESATLTGCGKRFKLVRRGDLLVVEEPFESEDFVIHCANHGLQVYFR